ncbi:MAG: hypothetical protein EXS38_09820 [Opitutus sp.]|nr:hypothetical protein [Opitutus sp.]
MNEDDPAFPSFRGVVNSTTALGVAAGLITVAVLIWGYRINRNLQAELVRLRGENQELALLERDNRRIERMAGEAEKLRRELADLPALRAAVAAPDPRPKAGVAVITVTPQGALRWDKDEVAMADIPRRLQEFHRQYPATDSLLVVHGMGASFAVIASVLDAARQAGLVKCVLDGEGRPEVGVRDWF